MFDIHHSIQMMLFTVYCRLLSIKIIQWHLDAFIMDASLIHEIDHALDLAFGTIGWFLVIFVSIGWT
jgi:hypothetical protein